VQNIRWKTFWLCSFYAFFCLIVGLFTSLTVALLLFIVGLTAVLFHHIYWLDKLFAWLKNPVIADIPNGRGTWDKVFSALYQEYRRHTRNQNQLALALNRFRRAASALPDGVVALNERNEIEWCNGPAEQMLGIHLNQDEHQPINYLVRQQSFLNYLQSNDYSEPLKLKSWLDAEITLELQLVDFGAKQKLLVCRDVSQLEKIDLMRRDFIANVSHELRTPLTVVAGFLETLCDMDGAVPESTRHYFNMMQDQTTRMKLLIEDLLVLSQIENNAQAPEEITINMPQLFQQLLSDAEGLSAGKHHFIVHVQDSNLIGAQNEIQSACSNLISNAIRYSPDGGNITIQWAIKNGEGVFSVTDQGIGIAPHHIDRLTERFYRVDRSRSRLNGGTGLGLSIVKHILIRHQAKLDIQSEPNVGSTFSAVFPATRIAIAKNIDSD
jgi:two-component system phosphate regulon sensor histidine kinase PhoR